MMSNLFATTNVSLEPHYLADLQKTRVFLVSWTYQDPIFLKDRVWDVYFDHTTKKFYLFNGHDVEMIGKAKLNTYMMRHETENQLFEMLAKVSIAFFL
jgi:hypothetical protein